MEDLGKKKKRDKQIFYFGAEKKRERHRPHLFNARGN